MTEFRGGAGDEFRQRLLVEARTKEREEFQKNLKEMSDAAKRGVVSIDEKFAGRSDTLEEELKRQTVGLVTLEDFKRKRVRLEDEIIKSQQKNAAQAAPKEKKSKVEKSKFSFGFEDGEEEENGENVEDEEHKVKKNPFVETSFLPDREREEEERRERDALAKKWKEDQEKIKNEMIDVTYSYWDGSGHRKTMNLKKGTTVAQFLDKVRQEFRDLRGVSVDGLMFIKEDLIIPHFYSFYDLILMRARGKSGPLFHFDVHEDIRMVNDSRIEKDESHAGKVVERRWYERNQHIFPASRWEVFDPEKKYDKYTIHGGEVR